MKEIKTVTIVGANGTMGARSAGIIAGFGDARVYMVAKTLEKAREGISIAAQSVKAQVVAEKMIPATYQDMDSCIADSDWVFELVSENLELKKNINRQIAQARKPGTFVSTVTSGLSVTELSKEFDQEGQSLYFGTHFYNPPYKMLLCEFVSHDKSDLKSARIFKKYLKHRLRRVVVDVKDEPAFIGNRLGFYFLNKVARFVETQNMDVNEMDQILGRFTGRAMPPLALIDFVGLDVHKAIVDNLYENTADEGHADFKCPDYINYLVAKGALGYKSSQGLFKREKDEGGGIIKKIYDLDKNTYRIPDKKKYKFAEDMKEALRVSDYRKARKSLLENSGREAGICLAFLLDYISYGLSLAGSLVEEKEDVDRVMASGFNWAPPSALVDFLGGRTIVVKLLEKFDRKIPALLQNSFEGEMYLLNNEFDARRYFKAY